MNDLCFASNLTSGEWAAWAQAVGVFIAVCVAFWVGNLQNRTQLRAVAFAQATARQQSLQTVDYLAKASTNALTESARRLTSRSDVHSLGQWESAELAAELTVLSNLLGEIPLYQIPADVSELALLIAATIRGASREITRALTNHRQMDSAVFEELFARAASNPKCNTTACKVVA